MHADALYRRASLSTCYVADEALSVVQISARLPHDIQYNTEWVIWKSEYSRTVPS